MCWSRCFRSCVQSTATTPICAASMPMAVSIAPRASFEAKGVNPRSASRSFINGLAVTATRPGAPVDAERRPPQAAPFMGKRGKSAIGQLRHEAREESSELCRFPFRELAEVYDVIVYVSA